MKTCLYLFLFLVLLCNFLRAQNPPLDEVIKQLNAIDAEINKRNQLGKMTLPEAFEMKHAFLRTLSRECMHELLNEKNTLKALKDPMSGMLPQLFAAMVDGYGKGESVQQIAAEIADKQLPSEWRLLRIQSFWIGAMPPVMSKPQMTLPDAEGLQAWGESIRSFAGTPDYDNALLESYETGRYFVALYSKLYPELGKLVIARDEAPLKAQPVSAERDLGIELISTLRQMEEQLRKHKGYKPFEAERPYFEKKFTSTQFDLPEGITIAGSTVRNMVTEQAHPLQLQQSTPTVNSPSPTIAPSPVTSATPTKESKTESSSVFLYLSAAVLIFVAIGAVRLWRRK